MNRPFGKHPKILITGALGQIGTELVYALCERYGADSVIATDVSDSPPKRLPCTYRQLNVLDKTSLHALIIAENIKSVYHLAAVLSASGEQSPLKTWELNMQGLLHVLEIAKLDQLKVFWPSSIAVFGPDAPKVMCPQDASTHPTTVYGISKLAGENWCRYYHQKYGVDVRSLRFPGLIGHRALPGGGTTDYAVAIFREALQRSAYTSFLSASTFLPMMFMDDAINAIMQLMDAPIETIRIRTAYNLGAMSFCPAELSAEIKKHLPAFKITYRPDERQQIADSWPESIDDNAARKDWGWRPGYDLERMTATMLRHLALKDNFSLS